MPMVRQGTPVIYMDRGFNNWWVVARFRINFFIAPEGVRVHEPPTLPSHRLLANLSPPDDVSFNLRTLHLRVAPVDIPDINGVVRRWETIVLSDAWQLETLARILASPSNRLPLELY